MERMEERNYINYIYRVKQLCHLQKDPLKNNFFFRNHEYCEIFIFRLLCFYSGPVNISYVSSFFFLNLLVP